MATEKLYINAFDLYKGMIISGFKLIKIIVDKETLNNYQSYAINMTWEKTRRSCSKYKLLNELNKRSGKIIVYSPRKDYDNNTRKIEVPYKCDFGDLKIGYASDNFISIHSLGHCYCLNSN